MNESPKTANVFKNRNFRLTFFGALVSELGAVLYSFAVSFYILEISNNNAFLQGLYLAVCGIMMLLFTPIGGVLGDRINKAVIMFLCDYVKGGLILLAIALMLLFPGKSAHIAILFAVGILGNAVSGIFSPAAGSLFPHIVEEEKLQQANAYFSIKSALQTILGVVLAGVLYAALPIHLLFLFVGVCYVLSGVSEMFIRYEQAKKEGKLTIRVAFADMGEGLAYLKTQKAIIALMLSVLFLNFFLSPIASNFVPFFIKTDVAGASSYLFDHLLTPELWSSVFSVILGVSSLAGSVILSAKPQEEKCGRKIALRILATALIMTVLTVSYHLCVAGGNSLNAFLLLFSGGCLVIGFLLACVNIPINTTFMRVVDRDKLSKVTSISSILSQGLIPFSSILAGAVLQTFGCTPLLLICTVGFVVSALMLLFNKDVKNL
ncbi:MAG: MFS transporter [Lachnospiraceae bacterium]|nr:MFS transporter [Lachnospiraceae bacterium]